jgi:hypothetical protein
MSSEDDRRGDRAYLLERDEGATDLGRAELGVVKRHDHGQRPDAEASDKATGKDVRVRTASGAGLDDNADDKEHAGDDDTKLAAKTIGEDTIGEDTDPSAELKNRSEQASENRVGDALNAGRVLEVLHVEDLTEHALVVSIDETALPRCRERTGLS